MKRATIVAVVVSLVLAASQAAEATIIWGVTGTQNMNQATARSEVFTVDTSTWTSALLYTTSLVDGKGTNFSDIAVTPSGRVYCTGSAYSAGGSFFKDFFMLDATTGQVSKTWLTIHGKTINGLTAESDTSLLAVEGGQTSQTTPHLLRITLDGAGDFVSLTDLGQIDGAAGYSGGDIARRPDGSYFAAVLGNGDDIFQIPNPDVPGTASLLVHLSMGNVAGLAHDYDAVGQPLYGGIFTDNTRRLYQIDLGTGAMSPVADLSGTVTWNVFGLDTPEPATLALLALGGVGLLARRRRA